MKPMSEAHFAILRRHMVEAIGIRDSREAQFWPDTKVMPRALVGTHATSRRAFNCPITWVLRIDLVAASRADRIAVPIGLRFLRPHLFAP